METENKIIIKLDSPLESRNYNILKEKLKKGELYQEKNTKESTVEILTEPRIIPGKVSGFMYADGPGPDREVPAGTILVDGVNSYITNEEKERFFQKYEPCLDEEGHEIPGKYKAIVTVTAIKNPFNAPLEMVNGNGYSIQHGDKDCYIVESVVYPHFCSKEEFESKYEKRNVNSKRI